MSVWSGINQSVLLKNLMLLKFSNDTVIDHAHNPKIVLAGPFLVTYILLTYILLF